MKQIINILEQMKNTTVNNYVLAGLSSSLVGNNGHGKVRLFEMSRNQRDAITPHSHRFNFTCLVLRGSVTNTLWYKVDKDENPLDYDDADLYAVSQLKYSGKIGEHVPKLISEDYFFAVEEEFEEGNLYSMEAGDIHSIKFSKDAIVLFFEGVEQSKLSTIIEPIVNGKVIPTYENKPYMFTKNQ